MSEWKCTDPMLQSYEWRGFYAQRTYADRVALWHDGLRIGDYANLAEAMAAAQRHLAEVDKRSTAEARE